MLINKRKKGQVINLYKLIKQKKWISEFRNKVYEIMGDSLYDIVEVEEFVYKVMKVIYPLNRNLKSDKDALQKACAKLFKLAKIRKNVMSTLKEDGTFEKIKSKEKPVIQEFLNTYLQLETLPGITYKELEYTVRIDLKELNDLIQWYETEPFIQDVKTKNAQPRNTRIEFYLTSITAVFMSRREYYLII